MNKNQSVNEIIKEGTRLLDLFKGSKDPKTSWQIDFAFELGKYIELLNFYYKALQLTDAQSIGKNLTEDKVNFSQFSSIVAEATKIYSRKIQFLQQQVTIVLTTIFDKLSESVDNLSTTNLKKPISNRKKKDDSTTKTVSNVTFDLVTMLTKPINMKKLAKFENEYQSIFKSNDDCDLMFALSPPSRIKLIDSQVCYNIINKQNTFSSYIKAFEIPDNPGKYDNPVSEVLSLYCKTSLQKIFHIPECISKFVNIGQCSELLLSRNISIDNIVIDSSQHLLCSSPGYIDVNSAPDEMPMDNTYASSKVEKSHPKGIIKLANEPLVSRVNCERRLLSKKKDFILCNLRSINEIKLLTDVTKLLEDEDYSYELFIKSPMIKHIDNPGLTSSYFSEYRRKLDFDFSKAKADKENKVITKTNHSDNSLTALTGDDIDGKILTCFSDYEISQDFSDHSALPQEDNLINSFFNVSSLSIDKSTDDGHQSQNNENIAAVNLSTINNNELNVSTFSVDNFSFMLTNSYENELKVNSSLGIYNITTSKSQILSELAESGEYLTNLSEYKNASSYQKQRMARLFYTTLILASENTIKIDSCSDQLLIKALK